MKSCRTSLRRFKGNAPRPRIARAPRGMVLIVVLVVVMVLALAAYTFTDLMLTHFEAVEHNGRNVQARALVDSGVDAVRMFLLLDPATQAEAGGAYNNPLIFQGLPVAYDTANPQRSGCVTVLAPQLDGQGNPLGVRYGLEDESCRINLNVLVSLFDNAAGAALVQAANRASGADASGGSGAGGASGAGGGFGANSGATTTGGAAGAGAANSSTSNTGNSTSPSTGSGSSGSGATGTGSSSSGSSTGGQTGNARDLLMTLPGMTVEVADAILDWIDEDDEPREFGAESEYYTTLVPPYTPRNKPLLTVEELLLVRGVTPYLLFGFDQNRNGVMDPNELQAATAAASANGGAGLAAMESGSMPGSGWSSYLTLHSTEKNVNSLGEPRIDLNGQDLQALSDQLSLVFEPPEVTFILGYRLSGPYSDPNSGTNTNGNSSSGSSTQGVVKAGQLDLTASPSTNISSVYDLIDAQVSVTFENDQEATILGPVFPKAKAAEFLPKLLDNVTVNTAATIPGRININQAPLTILRGIPGMTEDMAVSIADARGGIDPSNSADPTFGNEAWPLVQGLVTLDQMKALAPFITAGGDVYRAQVVGYFLDGQASARAEVIVDATGDVPRVVFWRDITHLGRGYPLQTLGVAALPSM